MGQIASAAPLLDSPVRDRVVLVGTDYFMILDPGPELLQARGFILLN